MAPATPVLTPAGLEPAFDLAAYYPVLIYAAVVVAMASPTTFTRRSISEPAMTSGGAIIRTSPRTLMRTPRSAAAFRQRGPIRALAG